MKRRAVLAAAVICIGVLGLAAQCLTPEAAAIVGEWYLNGTFDLYTEYPEFVTQTLTETIIFSADGTFTASGSSGGASFYGAGTYDYHGAAETIDMTFAVWEMPVGTPQTAPLMPTQECVILADTMTFTQPPGDYMWADPLVFTRQ